MKRKVLFCLAATLLSACTGGGPSPRTVGLAADLVTDDAVNPGPDDALFLGAGDIARCSQLQNAIATGDLIRALIGKHPDAKVFTAGDNAYEDGTTTEFASCYEPAWGSFNDRTAPAPGNHDYHTPGAIPYFDYFELYRVDPVAKSRGYYSFDLKGWHIVSLNSNVPMDAGSSQVAWLDNDLASTQKRCILAFWHHPLFSSGRHGSQPNDPGRLTGDLWRTLEKYEADVIVNGHDHDYERFAPQDHTGAASASGIREFVVGTGGAELRRFSTVQPNSDHRDDRRHGILVLTLGPNHYTWAFLGTDGKAYDRSTGVLECHD
jgi:acid phosphatase type 7